MALIAVLNKHLVVLVIISGIFFAWVFISQVLNIVGSSAQVAYELTEYANKDYEAALQLTSDRIRLEYEKVSVYLQREDADRLAIRALETARDLAENMAVILRARDILRIIDPAGRLIVISCCCLLITIELRNARRIDNLSQVGKDTG